MHTRAILSASLLALCAAPAFAADGGSWDFWVRAQASAGQLGLGGDAKWSDNGVGGATFNMSDVGLDDSEVTPAIELGAGTPIFDFHGFLGWQSWSTEGSATVTSPFNFGGSSISGAVSSKATLDDLYVEFNWSPIALNLGGFSIGLAAHQISLTTELTTVGVSEKLDESATLPTLAVRAYVAPLDMLEAEVMVHGLAVPLGDVSGSLLFAQVQVAYYPMEYVGVIGGWRTTMLDLDFESGGSKVEASLDLSGPYLGVAAQF